VNAADFVYPVLGSLVLFVCFMSLPLLGLSMMHMIGKTN
jgi:hypothetical protein